MTLHSVQSLTECDNPGCDALSDGVEPEEWFEVSLGGSVSEKFDYCSFHCMKAHMDEVDKNEYLSGLKADRYTRYNVSLHDIQEFGKVVETE